MSQDGYVQVPPNSTGGKVDCASLSVAGQTVVRQRVVISDNASSANFATVTGGALLVTGALSVGPISKIDAISATVTVAGNVNISTMPAVNISAMPNVVLAAGANNIGSVNNISATVNVVLSSAIAKIALSAGTANIGSINNISATVTVAGNVTATIAGTVPVSGNVSAVIIGTVPISGTIDKISATATAVIGGFLDPSGNQRNVVDSANTALRVNVVAGGTGGGTIDKISATVTVAGTINISSMPAISVGPISTIDKISATVTVAGSVGINSGTLSLSGKLDGISSTVTVAGTVALGAGAANIGTINNISATVNVAGSLTVGGTPGGSSFSAGSSFTMIGGTDGTTARGLLMDAAGHAIVSGTVVLAAGTNNIGTLNNISAQVAVSGSVTIINNINISAMPNVVLAAGANNIGTLNGISATVNVNIAAQSAGLAVVVQGPVAVNGSVTAGNNPVLMGGRVKTSASTTAAAKDAQFLWLDKAGRLIVQSNAPSLHPSATHGPKSVTLSASANTVLVASAGTACIFIDSLMVTSNLAGVTRVDVYETASSAAPEVSAYLAIGGGGFVQQFNPPWQLSAGQALSGRLKPSASAQVIVQVHFHVGPA